MFDAESIPEVSRKRQRMPLPISNAVNDDQTAKFWDEDAKVAVTSKEEAFELSNLAGAKSGLEGPLREKSIAEELAMLNEAGTWGMADAPAGIVGLKQIFWATKGPAASLVCCEARLVVLFETFVPVASGVKVQFSPVFDHIFSNPERDHGSSSGAYVEPRTGPQVQVRFRFEHVRTISATRDPLFYEIWCQKLRKSDVALLTVVYMTCGNI